MFSNRSGQRKEVLCCGNTRTRAADAMDCNLSPGQFNVTRQTRICSIYFEGGLSPTKLNPVSLDICIPTTSSVKTSEKSYWPRGEMSKARRQWKQTSRSRKVFTSRKKKKQDVNTLEGRIFCSWMSQYSLLCAHLPWWRGLWWPRNAIRKLCSIS